MKKYIDFKAPKEGILDVLAICRSQWKPTSITIQPLTESGLVNHLYLCQEENEKLLLRINDPVSRFTFIDRDYEALIFEHLSKEHMCMAPVCRFTNGLVYNYAEGSVLSPAMMHNEHIMKLIAQKMYHLHCI